jgi:hypothetical protein
VCSNTEAMESGEVPFYRYWLAKIGHYATVGVEAHAGQVGQKYVALHLPVEMVTVGDVSHLCSLVTCHVGAGKRGITLPPFTTSTTRRL